jgi:MAPEG family
MAGDLTYLVWSAILTVVMMLIAVAGTCQQVGLPMLAGDRQGMPENLVLLAILVLVANVARKSNANTILGAQIFFWARVGYAGLYIGGIAWARTAAWGVSMIGLLIILWQLL